MNEHLLNFEAELFEQSLSTIIKTCKNQKNILIISIEPERFQNFFNSNESIIEILQYNFNENIFDKIQNKDFKIIVLDRILETLSDPKELLEKLSKFLSLNGFLLIHFYNFSNIINRIKLLDGDLHNQNFTLSARFFSLRDILLLFSKIGFSITKLERISKKITLSNQTLLKNYVIPQELLDSLYCDSESQTFFYLFFVAPINENSNVSREWAFKFDKNLVSENLKISFENIKNDYEKKIIYLKQSNQEQYDLIKYLNQGLSDKDAYADQISGAKDKHYQSIIHTIIRDKDAYADQIIRDKDKHYQSIIHTIIRDKDAYADQISGDKDEHFQSIINTIVRDKDDVINELQKSRIFTLLKIFDRIRGKSLD